MISLSDEQKLAMRLGLANQGATQQAQPVTSMMGRLSPEQQSGMRTAMTTGGQPQAPMSQAPKQLGTQPTQQFSPELQSLFKSDQKKKNPEKESGSEYLQRKGIDYATNTATNALANTAENAVSNWISPNGANVSGSTVKAPDGTTIEGNTVKTSDGKTLTGSKAGEYLGYAAAALGAYDTFKNRGKLTDKQEAFGYGNAGLSAAQAFTGGNPYLSAAQTAGGVYNSLDNDKLTGEQKANAAVRSGTLGAANAYTFGLAGLAEGYGRRQWGGTMDKLDKLDAMTNLATGPTAWLGGKALSDFGSGKSKSQQGRDQIREALEERGVINQDGKKDWTLNFSDGTTFDLGKDGGARLVGTGGKERQYSDVDFEDPRAANTVGALNPLAAIITGGNPKLRSDMAGSYTNAVLSGSDENLGGRLKEMYEKHGIDQQSALTSIDQLLAADKIDEPTALAYKNGVNQVFGAPATGGPLPPKTAAPPSGKRGKKRRKTKAPVATPAAVTLPQEEQRYFPSPQEEMNWVPPQWTPESYGSAFERALTYRGRKMIPETRG